MFSAILKVRHDLIKWEKAEQDRIRKAVSFALSKTSFQLRKDAMNDLKTGRLSLRKLSYLSDRSDPRFKQPKGKRARAKARSVRNPLTSLFKAIVYRVDKRNLRAMIGFPDTGGYSWATKIAEKSADGYNWQYSERAKAYLHSIGVHLKPTTSIGRVPPRDIMAAVWQKHEIKVLNSLDTLIGRKLKGDYIETPEYRGKK